MTGWRLVLRLARREVLRRPGRTALVMLLVALPVAAMAVAVTIVRTDQTTLAGDWAQNNGTADARAFSEESLDLLPDGATSVPVRSWSTNLRAVDGLRRGVSFFDPTGLEAAGPVGPVLVEGRLPSAAGEITLDRRSARALGAEVGEELAIDRPSEAVLTVVGLVENPTCLSCPDAHATRATIALILPAARDQAPARWMIDLPPLSLEEQAELYRASAGSILTRDLYVSGWEPEGVPRGSDDGVRWAYVLGAVALTVVGIVISAAFAVGARRQLVTLGQLSASGASPATLRASLVIQGTVTGVLGAIVGLGLAGGALVGLRSVFEEVVLDQRIETYAARPMELLGAALVGVVAATLAALIPARTAAQAPTLSALAGRRPLSPVPRRLIGWGLVTMAGGLALLGIAVVGSRDGGSGQLWAFVAIVGGLAELLGACAIAPALVARLEPLAARLRGSWRMAARSLARHRTRTGAVVGAVCAAAGLAIAASALLQGAEARDPEFLEPSPRVVVAGVRIQQEVALPTGEVTYREDLAPIDGGLQAALQRVLPQAELATVREARSPQGGDGSVPWWDVPNPSQGGSMADGGVVGWSFERFVVADEMVLDLVGLDARERAELDEVGVAVLVRAGGGRQVTATEADQAGAGRQVPVVALEADHAIGSPLTELVITEAAAVRLGLEVSPGATVFVNPSPLDARQRELVSDLAHDAQWDAGRADVAGSTTTLVDAAASTNRWVEVTFRHPTSGPSPFQLELALTGLALVFCLFVVGTSLALAAAESKDERDVLTVAGAPPRTLARMAGARAWLLAGLGGLLAVPVGFLPVVVFTRTITDEWSQPYPLIFPARTVLVLVVVVPTIVALVAMAASAVAQRLRPIHVSTAVFE